MGVSRAFSSHTNARRPTSCTSAAGADAGAGAARRRHHLQLVLPHHYNLHSLRVPKQTPLVPARFFSGSTESGLQLATCARDSFSLPSRFALTLMEDIAQLHVGMYVGEMKRISPILPDRTVILAAFSENSYGIAVSVTDLGVTVGFTLSMGKLRNTTPRKIQNVEKKYHSDIEEEKNWDNNTKHGSIPSA